MRAVALAIVLAAGILAGCSLVPTQSEVPVDQLPVGVMVVTPPDQLRIDAINQTTIPVVLVVNGMPRELGPGTSQQLGIADLGPLPWDMRVTTASGRELLHDTLNDGVVSRTNRGHGQGEMTGFLARADLSCGQLFLVTGVASYGPAPGPGAPGDCGQ
jgi:hypothetical protein